MRSTNSRFGNDTSLIEIVEPLGASALATTPVGAEVAEAAPAALRAVTRTRSVVPSSAAVRTYVFPVAPLMSEQLPPVRSQRRHWYENVIGCCPVQAPVFAVRVWPTCGVPLMVGGAVSRGRAGAACTIAVAFDVAVADPSEFDAVTRTRSR